MEALCCLGWGRVGEEQMIPVTWILRILNRDLVEADSQAGFLTESGGRIEKETGTEIEIEAEMKMRMKGMTIGRETLIEIERGTEEVEDQVTEIETRGATG